MKWVVYKCNVNVSHYGLENGIYVYGEVQSCTDPEE